MKTAMLSVMALGLAAAACAASNGGTENGDQDLTSSTPHSVFFCDLSSGDGTEGSDFTLTLGTGSVSVAFKEYGDLTANLDSSQSGVPSTSSRYLITGIGDNGVATKLVIPKNLANDSRAMVHIDSTSVKNNYSTNDFLCKPVAAPAPDAGPQSGVVGTLNVTCSSKDSDNPFGTSASLTLTNDNLSIALDDISGTGSFDASYKPTAANASYVRYAIDGSLFDEDATNVLVQKSLLSGQPGTIKVQASGEGFESGEFDCTVK